MLGAGKGGSVGIVRHIGNWHRLSISDLLEAAFLESQIDGEQQSLAYCWVRANHQPYEH